LEVCRSALQHCQTAYALAQRWHGFERILNLIFGTQLELLRALRVTSPLGPISIFRFFTQHEELLPPGKAEYYPWINWLEKNKLVEVEASGMVRITQIGLEFLKYVDDNYYPGTPARAG
jgi:hypothetical protein